MGREIINQTGSEKHLDTDFPDTHELIFRIKRADKEKNKNEQTDTDV